MTVTSSEPDLPPLAPGAGRPAALDRRRPDPPAVTVVVPTFNEAENLPILLGRLADVLAPFDHEVVVVDDDSPDGTWRVAQDLAERDPRLRVIRRLGERGLSSAVMAGMQASRGRVLAVLDADLQHDEAILPAMLDEVLADRADVCVGSREADGGSYGDFGRGRRLISWGGAVLARKLLGLQVSDVMSGFFVVSRRRLDEVAARVNPRGFKVLLELLARGPRPRVVEVGYRFRMRQHGTTKLTGSVVAAYLLALATLAGGRWLSTTFVAYALVGVVGLGVRAAVHLAALAAGAGTAAALVLGFQASVVGNYLLNNRFTFATERRRGRRLCSGFVLFQLVSLHGLLVQSGVVATLGTGRAATVVPGGTAGGVVVLAASFAAATVGNYALNRTVTWRLPRA